MKLRSKLIAAAATVALAASMSASALSISTVTIEGNATPYKLASQLNVATDPDAVATLVALLEPTTGALPAGNVLLTVSLTNATFPTALAGSNVVGVEVAGADCSLAAVSISSGGGAGSSSVTFLVSNAQGCEVAGAEGLQFTADIRPNSTGNVGLTMNLTTEANNQVDGPQATASVVTRNNPFTIALVADAVLSQATLPNFTSITNEVIGTVQVEIDGTVNSDFAGTPVDDTDLATVALSISGDMFAYSGSGEVYVDLDSSNAVNGNEELTIAGSTASRTFSGADVTALVGGVRNIRLSPNGTSPILASSYNATVTATPDTAAVDIPWSAGDVTGALALQSVSREGTQITMPWFASGTQAGITGSNNLVRVGNTGGTAITALYVQILNNSDGTFVNPGVVPLTGVTIPANGTTLISSQNIEDAIGDNWGTGDVQLTVEAPEASVTARRLIFNGSSFTEISSGTVEDDNN